MLEDKSAQQLYRTATFHELWARTYERGVVRKMQRTPWHSMAQDVGNRRVFWLWCSCCTARAWSSFLPLLQEVSSMCKTRNQLTVKLRRIWKPMGANCSGCCCKIIPPVNFPVTSVLMPLSS